MTFLYRFFVSDFPDESPETMPCTFRYYKTAVSQFCWLEVTVFSLVDEMIKKSKVKVQMNTSHTLSKGLCVKDNRALMCTRK